MPIIIGIDKICAKRYFGAEESMKRVIAAVAVTSEWGIGMQGKLPWSCRLKFEHVLCSDVWMLF